MKLGERIKLARGENWLISRYEEWLLADHDPEAEAAIAQEIISRPERDRTQGWSASSAGRCEREQLFRAIGAPFGGFKVGVHNIFQNGHYVHLRHQVAGLRMGYLSEVEVPVRLDEYNVRGTMDGICSDGGGAEFKSINDYGFRGVRQFGPLDEHLLQVDAYMVASGIPFFRILYENKNDNTMKEFMVERNEKRFEKNKEAWLSMSKHLEEKTMPRVLDECMNFKGRYLQCPYASVCLEVENDPRRYIPLMSSSPKK